MNNTAIKSWVKRRARIVGSIVGTTSQDAVLTYDDGPDPNHTSGILTALASHGASATFFVLLTRTRRYPALLDEILSAGHEVGLHGVDHRRLTDFSYPEARRRTRDAKAELEDRIGRPVRWFRPPYGGQSLKTWHAVRAVGLIPVMWNATTWDWKEVEQTQRVDEVVRQARPGTILLAHDGFAGLEDGAQDGPEPSVNRAELAGLVLSVYRARELRCVSLGTALQHSIPVMEASFRRH